MTNPFDYFYYKMALVDQTIGWGTFSGRMQVGIVFNCFLLDLGILSDIKPSLCFFGGIILIWILVALFVLTDKRLLRAREKYKNESPTHRAIGNLLVFVFAAGSIVGFFILIS